MPHQLFSNTHTPTPAAIPCPCSRCGIKERTCRYTTLRNLHPSGITRAERYRLRVRGRGQSTRPTHGTPSRTPREKKRRKGSGGQELRDAAGSSTSTYNFVCLFADRSDIEELSCIVLYTRKPNHGDLTTYTIRTQSATIECVFEEVKKRGRPHFIPIFLNTLHDIFRPERFFPFPWLERDDGVRDLVRGEGGFV